MTSDELKAVAVGAVVGHADCPGLLFRVTAVDAEDDGEGGPAAVVRVAADCLQADGGFEFTAADDTLGKVVPRHEAGVKVTTGYGVRRQRVKDVRVAADKQFAGHVLVNGHADVSNTAVRSWRVATPDNSWHMGFRLTAQPGTLFVTGDMGHCAWSREYDMLSWAAGSIDSIDYFAEKVPRSIRTEEWSADVARAWVWEKWAELSLQVLHGEFRQPVRYGAREKKSKEEVLIDLLDARNRLTGLATGGNKSSFTAYLHDDTGWVDGCDMPNLCEYTTNFLWCREAVRCGLRLLGYLPKGGAK